MKLEAFNYELPQSLIALSYAGAVTP